MKSNTLAEPDPKPASLPYMVSGVSFHRSPVEVRERVSLPAERLPEGLRFVGDQAGVRECMLLSTCNRTELYLSVEDRVDGQELFLCFTQELCGFDLSPVADQIYVLRGPAAVKHLFRVAASLDSLVLGESQILGQLKAAFRCAETLECVGRDLHRWVPRAFSAAKLVRAQTGIFESAVSVSSVAVELSKKIFEDLSGKKVVLFGAGKMSELAAIHLREAGASSIAVVNRTFSRAEEVAGKCCGLAIEFERRWDEVAGADVVICSTNAPNYVLAAEDIREVLGHRLHRPLLFLDISVPRNVDPEIANLDGAYLFNIDDLERIVLANRRSRQAEALRAEMVVQSVLEKFLMEGDRSQVTPTIAAIRDQVRSICQSELDRLEQKLPGLSKEQREELELMLHRIAQKIVHPAIMELKAAGNSESTGLRSAQVGKIFGIDGETSPC